MRHSEQFKTEKHDERFLLEIHTDNPAHEARIRWKSAERSLSGVWGRLNLPEDMSRGADQVIREPILSFGSNKSISIAGQERRSIQLSRSLARRLQDLLDELGTASVDGEHICDDASRFPAGIQYETQISTKNLDKTRWDSDRQIMWYAPDRPPAQNPSSRFAELVSQLDVYGYQIENGELIHRTEEYPSSEAVNELQQLLQQAIPDSDEQSDADSHRIDEPLK